MSTTRLAYRFTQLLALVAILTMVIAACAPAPAASPTAAPKPTEAPKAAATTAPAATVAATATTAPAASPTAVAKPTEAPKPTAAPAASPTAAAKPTAAASASPAAITGPNIDRIKKAGKFVVLMDATFAPMEFKDEKGQVVGADVDIATEVAKDLGVKLEIQNTNWDGIFPALKAGKGDAIFSSVTITDERKKEMSFSNPYYQAGQVILVKSDNTTIKGPDDLKGKVVGVQISTTGQEAAEKIQGIKEIKKYDGGADTCLAVDSGKVEASVIDVMVALAYAKEHPTVKLVDRKPFAAEDLGVAVAKDATDLQAFINQSLDAMKKDGRLDKILEKYTLK